MVIDFESTVKLPGKEVPLRQRILKDYETSYCHHDAFCCSGGDVCQPAMGGVEREASFPGFFSFCEALIPSLYFPTANLFQKNLLR